MMSIIWWLNRNLRAEQRNQSIYSIWKDLQFNMKEWRRKKGRTGTTINRTCCSHFIEKTKDWTSSIRKYGRVKSVIWHPLLWRETRYYIQQWTSIFNKLTAVETWCPQWRLHNNSSQDALLMSCQPSFPSHSLSISKKRIIRIDIRAKKSCHFLMSNCSHNWNRIKA